MPVEFQPGDAVGVPSSNGQFWLPFIFVGRDAEGGTTLRALGARPNVSTYIYFPIEIVPAHEATFTHPCFLCSRFGYVRNALRLQYAGPSFREVATGWIEEYSVVKCPICEGEGRFEWNPFAPQHTCAEPSTWVRSAEPDAVIAA